MKTVFSPRHLGHADQVELVAGAIVPGFELPSRAEYVVDRIKTVGLGPVLPPAVHDLSTAHKVHRKDYLDFLPTIWDRWTAEGRSGTALPFTWPTRGLRGDAPPEFIDGLLGYYSFDAGCGVVEGTWDAIKSSHDVALTAAGLVQAGDRAAFALCRPPGHHAGAGFMGGYCYINNAAVAAQWFRDNGARRVSILDVDYHHGNGTQEIFYSRADVQVINLHADPMQEYPYFLGHADERGAGAGEGYNLNYPMRFGTSWETWSASLDDACDRLLAYQPDVVVVSLGVDTFEKDPISKFKLKTEDFPKIGARIARLDLPTLFVMEGGYAVAEIGVNAAGVLTGFEGRS
ncbi:histone deacetylase family protein [Pararhizobium antarcticum]|uniref:Acetylpolyamine aminohydrolase n=1 Tax=Pararhizobium antarcticum TaxID=1798805 RepID=A0A657LQU1_9HYPH|nr:histone deacetylase family protein [Pararhizobium antarcticum]OJF92100.1 acetylpolyamine aminohydrolase [Rhizobium sp. 58]OJF94234.1 acetylpolyamine aminohydrolase [Pararhizobium antarcticum]